VRSLKMNWSLTTECHDKPGPRAARGRPPWLVQKSTSSHLLQPIRRTYGGPLLRRNLKMRTLSAHSSLSSHVFPTSQSRLERKIVLSRRRLPRSFSILWRDRCGGILFPGRSTIRRTDLVRLVRLIRTFCANQQPLPAQKGISSSVISVPANSSCCTGAR
jgi:hypothetical protein